MTEVSTELQPQSTDYNPQDTGRLVLDIIQSRRCIREGFIDREISQDIIEEVVESGLRAPSSKHAQPWKLHIVTGRDQLLELSEKVFRAKTAESFAPSNPSTGKPREWESTVTLSAEVLRNVGLGIFIENTGPFSGGREIIANSNREFINGALIGYSFEMIGFGAMIENMWLTAKARGLAGLFMGDVIAAEDEIKTHLSMEGDLVGVLALGYSDLDLPKRPTLKGNTVVYHTAQERSIPG